MIDLKKKEKEMDSLSKWVDLLELAHSTYNKHCVFVDYLKIAATVGQLMTEVLRIHPKMYALGGSWAMIGYGIELPRTPHDVDVIVDSRLLMTIKRLIELTDGLKVTSTESNSLYARITVEYKRLHIDILGADNPDFVIVPGLGGEIYHLDNLYHIADVKAKWARPKDLEDLKLINEFISDNALKDLNKELDSCIKPAPVSEKKKDDNGLPF